jgi:hypothetical protein
VVRGYGGHRATQPGPDWTPPELIVAGGTAVRFIEEQGGAEKIYDFTDLPVAPTVREWLVRVFARRLSPPAAIKRITSANPSNWMLRQFAELLGAATPPVNDVSEVTAAHVEAFRDRYTGLASQLAYVDILRGLLRDDPELPAEVRAALVTLRPTPPAAVAGEAPARSRPAEYSDAEWQQITTLLRRDVRMARERIRAGRALLHRFRAGQLASDSRVEDLGRMLDVFDRTGDIPRLHTGKPDPQVRELGGAGYVGTQLALTLQEMTAFALLLTAVTAENFGTVAAWPAVSHRPDGGVPGTGGIALIEASKPRRGPAREHMVTPLEDLPASLAGVLSAEDGDRRLFRSPLRIYELLLELTELARCHGDSQGAFGAYTSRPSRKGMYWVGLPESFHVYLWARENGFPATEDAEEVGLPPINVRWLRNTALARSRRPVAQTRATLNDRYLMRSDRVVRESRTVVAAALRQEVDKARAHQAVPVFTAEFVARAHTNPDTAAREAGLPVDTVAALVAGRNDTVLAGCINHNDGPRAEQGLPCPASFLACLDCPNARALPHHLPVQVAAADRIAALRPNLDPAAWRAKYALVLGQLDDILGHYTPAEHDQARRAITDQQHSLVEQLLDGRWDLR